MKIIEDGLGFLQRYDVAFILNNWSIAMPKEVINEIYSLNRPGREIIGIEQGCEFTYTLSRPESLAWLKNQDWLVDYSELRQKNPDELKAYICSYWKKSARELYHKIINREELDHKQNVQIITEYNCCVHRIHSVDLLYEYKIGHLDFIFPKEICSFAIRKPTSKYAQKISRKSIKELNHPKENSHIVWHFPKAEGPL